MSKQQKENFRKEQIRGTIKQLMKVRGLRTISVANYAKWRNLTDNQWLHSLKLNLQDGYLYLYGYNTSSDTRAGNRLENLDIDHYADAYKMVEDIFLNENTIPSKIKRNILVKMSR